MSRQESPGRWFQPGQLFECSRFSKNFIDKKLPKRFDRFAKTQSIINPPPLVIAKDQVEWALDRIHHAFKA
jgi:hypothetical protein